LFNIINKNIALKSKFDNDIAINKSMLGKQKNQKTNLEAI